MDRETLPPGVIEDERPGAVPPRIHLDRASVSVREILAGMPVEIAQAPENADVLWMRHGYRYWYPKLQPWQALNHIPNEGAMTRKADLTRGLHAYRNLAPAAEFSHHDFYPPSYRLDDAGDRAAFLAQLPDEDNPEKPWILKPSTLSRGIGIRIEWQMDWLRKALREGRKVYFMHEGSPVQYIIQRYIPDLLLLQGRKSELRIYWLIASLDPLLVLMHRKGTVRLTTRDFKMGEFNDPLIHITNTYQQNLHGGVGPDSVLKWNFPRLQAYLTQKKGVPDDYIDATLTPRLARILEFVVRACAAQLLQRPPSGHFFGLYGADIILDDQLTPWLTEIQKGPGLSHDDAIKRDIIPPMLCTALGFVLQVIEHRRSGKAVDGLPLPQDYIWVIGA